MRTYLPVYVRLPALQVPCTLPPPPKDPLALRTSSPSRAMLALLRNRFVLRFRDIQETDSASVCLLDAVDLRHVRPVLLDDVGPARPLRRPCLLPPRRG